MNTVNMDPEERRERGNVALDALAILAALFNDDTESAEAMISMYEYEGRAWELIQACMAHTTRLLHDFVIDPELALGAMAEAIRRNT